MIDSLVNWLKRYYNSISRQSGIVHKDKAMRQLDLDLWEMNWLVAAARESTNSIIFSLWEWEKRDWIVWFPLAARPLFKNLWFLMKAGGGASQSINHQSTILFNQNKKVCFVEELLELMKLILIERSEAAKWDWLFSCVGFVVFGWVIGWLASQWLRPREDKPNQQHKNKSIEWSRLFCEWIEWNETKAKKAMELVKLMEWTSAAQWNGMKATRPQGADAPR